MENPTSQQEYTACGVGRETDDTQTACMNTCSQPYWKCCACNIHVTGDSMHVVTLQYMPVAVMLHAQFCYMHVEYISHTHVTLM